MISKTRPEFLKTVSISRLQEKDINNMQWDKLVINRAVSYYKITQSDLQRPDLIAIKIYGTFQYFWPLMKFNEIDDIWNDLVANNMLIAPAGLDIEQYFSVTKTYGR